MPLRPISASFTISWTAHDSWSESYVGVRRLVHQLLPPTASEHSAEDSALCQLSLVGANHLMEVALYKILQPLAAEANESSGSLTPALLEEASYHQMLTRWLPTASGNALSCREQPFKSTEALRKRRNATIHKSSALATIQMARSALWSSVQGCRALYLHAAVAFPYESLLEEYPLQDDIWFSEVPSPPDAP